MQYLSHSIYMKKVINILCNSVFCFYCKLFANLSLWTQWLWYLFLKILKFFEKMKFDLSSWKISQKNQKITFDYSPHISLCKSQGNCSTKKNRFKKRKEDYWISPKVKNCKISIHSVLMRYFLSTNFDIHKKIKNYSCSISSIVLYSPIIRDPYFEINQKKFLILLYSTYAILDASKKIMSPYRIIMYTYRIIMYIYRSMYIYRLICVLHYAWTYIFLIQFIGYLQCGRL